MIWLHLIGASGIYLQKQGWPKQQGQESSDSSVDSDTFSNCTNLMKKREALYEKQQRQQNNRRIYVGV
jgi:hypothetical protein